MQCPNLPLRTTWLRWVLARLLLVTAALAAPGCHPHPTGETRLQKSSASQADPLLLRTLAILATGTAPTADKLQAAVTQLARHEIELAEYVRSLLADPRFADDVAPRMILKEKLVRKSFGVGRTAVLQQTTRDGSTIYFLRKPCALTDAVAVHPWWALDTEILVCADSYRPSFFVISADRYCGVPFEGDTTPCGCGANLFRCFGSRQQQNDFFLSQADELRKTVGYVVQQNLPTQTIFTANQTFRDRNAEYLYQRARVELRVIDTVPDYRQWPEGGAWAARPEVAAGQHAGLLTTPQLLYLEADRRQRLRTFYDFLWCKEPTAAGATAAGMLSLGTGNLQIKNEGWQELAARPICTNCHARLDYGMQFFNGHLDGHLGVHFLPAAQSADVGQLFGDDINDRRGEAPLNPQAFAELAVAQKEFGRCMVRNVSEHVFGHRGTRETEQALGKSFAQTGTLRELMQVALLRYAELWGARDSVIPPAALAATAPGSPDDAAKVRPISPQLRSLLARHCVRCHDEEPRDFGAPALSPTLLEQMLTQVSFGLMPKGAAGLVSQQRHELVQELIAVRWTAPEARAKAGTYFHSWHRSLPVQPLEAALNVIAATAGTPPARSHVRLLESMVHPDVAQYTPGFTAVTTIEALRLCKAAGYKAADLDRCLERATLPTNFIH